MKNFIYKLAAFTSSAEFVAYMAHMWFAYAAVTFNPYLAFPIFVLTGAKEFWFDIKYEQGETLKSGALHFAGYVTGIVLGLLRVHFL